MRLAIFWIIYTDSIYLLLLIHFLYQQTPLHIAVREGQEYTVKSLVAKGANVSIRDNYGVSM